MRNITLDTNIFIRYLVLENETLYHKAEKVFTSIEKGDLQAKVSLLVLNEIVWVLKRFYALKRSEFIPELRKIFSLEGILFIEVKKVVVMRTLDIMEETNFDFTDIYLSLITDKKEMVSFDKDFEQLYGGK